MLTKKKSHETMLKKISTRTYLTVLQLILIASASSRELPRDIEDSRELALEIVFPLH